MMIFKLLKTLLPRGWAWLLAQGSGIHGFFQNLAAGLSSQSGFTGPREYLDKAFEEGTPAGTSDISEYESMFGIPASEGLTEQQRRDRIAAAWRNTGGQSPRYIQDTLQSFGFPVYVHEWWNPGDLTPREPGAVLASAEYQLINKKETQVPNFVTYGGDHWMGDEVSFYGGQNGVFTAKDVQPIVTDPEKFGFFMYLGGETWPNNADIPAERRDEFETLVLQICPTHLFVGLLINYT